MDSQPVSKFDKLLSPINKFFLYLLIIYLPLQELFLHFLESYTRLSVAKIFWISHFYEPLIVLMIFLYLVKFAIERRLPKWPKFDVSLLVFLFLAVLMVAIRHNDLSRGLEGLRFLALPFIIYILARLSDYQNPKRLTRIYLFIAFLFAAIGVVEFFLLPAGYMARFLGLSNFGFGQNSLISTPQATALLAGPNQLASYLILAFFYLMHRFFTSKKPILREESSYFLILVALALGLTFSRSALLGIIVGVVWMFIYFGRSARDRIIYSILFIVVVLTAAVSLALQNGELPRDILTHGTSFSQHLLATKESFLQFIHGGAVKILFGFGVGSAGPTALKLGGIITENWYLQILFEVGVVGFIYLSIFLAGIVKSLYSGSKTLFFAIVALLINALFLHIFSDNPVMAVSIFIICGAVMNIETENPKSLPRRQAGKIQMSNEAQSPNV